MIEPGAIYKTKGNKWILMAVEVAHQYGNYSVWSCRQLGNNSFRELLVEDYWLESQERLA